MKKQQSKIDGSIFVSRSERASFAVNRKNDEIPRKSGWTWQKLSLAVPVAVMGVGIILFAVIQAFFSDKIETNFNAVSATDTIVIGTFDCTNAAQEWTAPYAGQFQLEVWGAAGGDNSATNTGGKGGYATGTIQLRAGEKIWVNVGCRGQTTTGSYAPGGWNGGGRGAKFSSLPTGGGGGATDIRIASESTGQPSLLTRVLVAGGGGGSGSNNGTATLINKGGAGGGLFGIDGITSSLHIGLGGTQTAGGTTGSDSRRDAVNGLGTFGQGGSMLAGTTNGLTTGGGGGGGWYGGGAGVWEGGGGGSGYAWTSAMAGNYPAGGLGSSSYDTAHWLEDTLLINGNSSMPDPDGNTITGRSGDGFAQITQIVLTPPTITLNGDDPLTILRGVPFDDPGAIASDVVDGDLTGDIVVDDSAVDTTTVGQYEVSYEVTNSANLTASITRTVKVIAALEYGCTKTAKSWTAPIDGQYKLDVWGADGGAVSNSIYNGHGGYASGLVKLKAGEEIFVYVGCKGEESSQSGYVNAGGWNGGGAAKNSTTNVRGGGGGATDVRVVADSLYNRIIVAGGGGGNSAHATNQKAGDGGGDTGADGSFGKGGSQSAGGAGQVTGGAAADFGVGSENTASTVGGGGGGWYGGGNGNGAGGGSGYVLTSSSYKPSGYFSQSANYYLASPVNVQYSQTGFVTNPASAGDGYAKISFSQLPTEPTISLVGANPLEIDHGSAFVDPGATAYDAIDGNISSSVVVSLGGLDVNISGNYTVTYSITNSFGLSASVSRQVTVKMQETSQGFACTNSTQVFVAPATGVYTLETWGAQGGAGTHAAGGKGGYSNGKISLTQGTTLYVYVGCQGVSSTASAPAGGWNGGGAGQGKAGSYVHGGGGGGSDIRIGSDTLYARAIVAGGGGGAGGASHNGFSTVGGYGGGLVGMTGDAQSGRTGGGGGTQTAGGVAGCYSSGTGCGLAGAFGQGGDSAGDYSNAFLGGGGGGGWYGGGGGGAGGPSGGGGSGYVLTSTSDKPPGYLLGSQYYMTDTEINGGNESIPAVGGGGEVGHAGDGYARISYSVPSIFDFNYTGAAQPWMAPSDGDYKLEVWGAQGGDGQTGTANGDYLGGRGGYTVGIVALSSGDALYVRVGGQGRKAGQTGDGLVSNSFNGGGLSDSQRIYNGWGRSGEGGGASDVRIGTDSLYARVIVGAGGGGAGIYDLGGTYKASGGAGGGLTGLDGENNGVAIGGGATQTAGGTSGGGFTTASGFGVGASMVLNGASVTSGAGGGGGWYGGGVSAQGSTVHNSGGGGGSSWLYTAANYSTWANAVGSSASGQWLLTSQYYLVDANTIVGTAAMPDPAGGTATGRSGNGYVRITKL
ncbi:MAG: DUF5011 domain-containing protein [Candidatus Nomurabacteria bacterium]|jgi:hypothetical protein|nr:DUF5011 domain-containing protein [Candidatus Nomurabacteria bacterium]